MIRSAIACAALLLSGVLADAHQAVPRYRPHEAESHKPHEATRRHPHEVSSHPKPQKPPKHVAAKHAKPPKMPKH